jgi:hypothetical protein
MEVVDSSQLKECSCGEQDPHSPVHWTKPGCEQHRDQIDPWHYTGNPNFHTDMESNNFIELCKLKLPQRPIDVTVSSTGYPRFNKNEMLTPGWCLDPLGRVFIILNGRAIFQRFTEGDLLMCSDNGSLYDQLTSKDMKQFLPHLQ